MPIKKKHILDKKTLIFIKNRKNLESLFEDNMFFHTILGDVGCIIEIIKGGFRLLIN